MAKIVALHDALAPDSLTSHLRNPGSSARPVNAHLVNKQARTDVLLRRPARPC